MPGLKPSDWYLCSQEMEYFNMNLRQLVVLGIRFLYASQHDPVLKEQIARMAAQVYAEDLDLEEEDRPVYQEFKSL